MKKAERFSKVTIGFFAVLILTALGSPQLLYAQNVISNIRLQNWAQENFGINLSLSKTPAQLAMNTESMRSPRSDQQIQDIHAHVAVLREQRMRHVELMRYHSRQMHFHLSRVNHYSGSMPVNNDTIRRRDNHIATTRRHNNLAKDQLRQQQTIDTQIEERLAQIRRIESSVMPLNRLALLAPTNARIAAQNQMIQSINPILVGRNIVFSTDWLQHIGNGQDQMTAAQFALWRDRTDRIYDAMAYLTGILPFYGERVTINIKTREELLRNMVVANASAHAHGWEPVFCYNIDDLQFTIYNVRRGSWSFIQIHEMAHIFDFGTGIFTLSGMSKNESMANFIAAFAMDVTGAHFFSFEFSPAFDHNNNGIVRGQNFRDSIIALTRQSRQNGNLRPFTPHGSHTSCAFSKYLHESVNRIGWKPVMLAFRSYKDMRLLRLVSHNFNNGTNPGRARDFFGRIQDFSGNPNLKQSITGGVVLNQHFNISPQIR